MQMPDAELATLKQLFSIPRRVKASDAQMQLLDSGQRGSHREGEIGVECWTFGKGRRIVLVHGWNSRGAQLGHFVAPLVDAG